MVQEFIEGFGIGFNFISSTGVVANAYIHKRINEHDGVSSYREMLDENAFGNSERSRALIKSIGWNGVGMLEYKAGNGEPVLMELNGRFFGSIDLSVKSGLNLPYQFLQLEIENKIPVAQSFKIGTKVRNLHDEVLLNLFALAKGKLVQYVKWKLAVVSSILKRNEFVEDNLFNDPGFVTSLYWADLKRVFSNNAKKLRLAFVKIRPVTKKDVFGKNLKIAFVCKGNICRSPFAEVYANAKKDHGFQFVSYGTFPHENRLPPTLSIRCAEQYGLTLEDYKSHFLGAEETKMIDLFLVMDKKNYLDLKQNGIPADKIRFLAEKEIADPYKKPISVFEKSFQQIAHSIDSIL
jgi:protein-tyrosine-phosphatase